MILHTFGVQVVTISVKAVQALLVLLRYLWMGGGSRKDAVYRSMLLDERGVGLIGLCGCIVGTEVC